VRIIFFGTPEFAIPTLEALVRKHEVALVVAQPDKPAGRGLKLQSPAVATRARELGLTVSQPARIRDDGFLSAIAALQPEVAVVVAYGKILPPALLTVPRRGFLNVHASLLPKYRGAAPIQRAIELGQIVTGVTIMRVDEELDHGPTLAIEPTEIGADEHAPSLAARLAQLGAGMMMRALESDVRETPQDHSGATYAPKVEKREGAIQWSDTTATIYNKYRAFDPWPGIFVADLKLLEIEPAAASGKAGTILAIDDAVTVATGDGAIRLLVVQRAGKSPQRAVDFARGAGWRAGTRLM
jgi:methionyl-tRNA formyltransferase